MADEFISTEELDERLDALARDVDTYDAGLDRLIDELDRAGKGIEIADPLSWRRETSARDHRPAGSLLEQFRVEVDAMETLDRAAEARLARRIELARRRLNKALDDAGLEPEDLDGDVHLETDGGSGERDLDCPFPKEVCCRWVELHALRTEMVERNLYLVLINVERYAHSRASRLDLIQEGSSALFRAVDGFDWRRGLLFRTYAVHWLNQAFRSFLYNFGNTVRVPVYLQKAMKHVHDAKARLGDPRAGAEAIADEADMGVNLVQSALGASRSTHSIDAQFGGDEDGPSLRDLLSLERSESGDPYEPSMEDVTLEDGVGMALDRLNERERRVIVKRFGLEGEREHTLAEIAAELGVSLERVRQIQVRAIAKMNTAKLRKAIDPFLV